MEVFTRAYVGREHGIETAERYLPNRILRKLEEFRNEAVCCGCQQRISPNIDMSVRGTSVFHPSCARKFDGQQQRSSMASSQVQNVIATIIGSAGQLFDRGGCGIYYSDEAGSGFMEHERFQFAAFDDAIARGGQELKVNHLGVGLRGRFLRIAPEGGELRFTFGLHEGQRERGILDKIHRGEIGACSIAFDRKAARLRYDDRNRIVWTSCPLTEISLLDGRSPAWYGTSIRIAS